MKADIEKVANSYIEEQNKERAAQGFKAMTAGEEDLVFNAFLEGWKRATNAWLEVLKKEG